MEENKRQLCVHKLLADAKEEYKLWGYMAGFAASCTMANGKFADRVCIKAQLDKVGRLTSRPRVHPELALTACCARCTVSILELEC